MEEFIKKLKCSIKDSLFEDLYTLPSRESSSQQREIVKMFSNRLITELSKNVPSFRWEQDHRMTNNSKDSINIFGLSEDVYVIIELSKPRADQIAKKMLSRMACHLDKNIIYIAICYPGTEKMDVNECVKYFGFGSMLMNKINKESNVIGCIIRKNFGIRFY